MAKKSKKLETEDERFERIGERVVKAFEELNAALEEAHGHKSMTVGLGMSSAKEKDEMFPWKPEAPTHFLYHIGRIVKTSFEVTPDSSIFMKTGGWKHVPSEETP